MILLANIVTTSKALVTRSDALVTTSNIHSKIEVSIHPAGSGSFVAERKNALDIFGSD